MLSELSRFFRSLGSVIDGFGERTRAVSALLRSPQTAFLIVTSPEAEPVREAGYLAERLAEAGMARAELIVNRVHSDGLDGKSLGQVEELLSARLGAPLARAWRATSPTSTCSRGATRRASSASPVLSAATRRSSCRT